MSVNFFAFISDWDMLGERVIVTEGTHTLTLVVDSTNLVPETDEDDNVFEREFVWDAPSDGGSESTLFTRLPDLVPTAPNGWSAPLITTSFPGDTVDGPLSVDATTYIRYNIRNAGLSSTTDAAWVYLYLDGTLVDRQLINEILVSHSISRAEWDGLFEIYNVSPGEHTLKLVADATGLVDELDEENNVFEMRLTWASGPVPPKEIEPPEPPATTPAPFTLPNLVPGWKFGSDGPIIVSHEMNTSLNTPLALGFTPYVSVTVFNESSVGDSEPFDVELYFDDIKVHTFNFDLSPRPAFFQFDDDWDELANEVDIDAGLHTLRIVIDPTNAIIETDETDNVYEADFFWSLDESEDSPLTTYTDDDIAAMLADLPELLDVRAPAIGNDGTDYTDDVLRIADAGYYLITGKSLADERVNILLLPHDDYLAWIDDEFAGDFATSDESEYESILARRENLKQNALGFKTRRLGKVTVVVDADQNVAGVINSLAHELGHMLQDFLNPAQTEARSTELLDGIQEAAAQQFERLFWLRLEQFTGLSLLSYPDFEGFRKLIDIQVAFWLGDFNNDEHSLGYLLQWLAVFDDPDFADLDAEISSQSGLGVSSTLRLYNHFVGLIPSEVRDYVIDRLESLEANALLIVNLAKNRLVSGLSPDDEGREPMRIPALLIP